MGVWLSFFPVLTLVYDTFICTSSYVFQWFWCGREDEDAEGIWGAALVRGGDTYEGTGYEQWAMTVMNDTMHDLRRGQNRCESGEAGMEGQELPFFIFWIYPLGYDATPR